MTEKSLTRQVTRGACGARTRDWRIMSPFNPVLPGCTSPFLSVPTCSRSSLHPLLLRAVIGSALAVRVARGPRTCHLMQRRTSHAD